ncbi:MAG TPA: thermonuclease family protein [Steroidobacteraceae bacterium]|nr:thermonuclease family protein [Steroidobacteraceae bacterium]
MLRALLAALCLLPLGAIAQANPPPLEGRVIHVADGDTVTVLDPDHRQHRVRLFGIDAPEHDQPFGTRARQNLADLVLGKDVRVAWRKRDRYGRIVGQIWVAAPDARCDSPPASCPKALDANLAQLTAGLAWHYKHYEREQSPQDRSRYASAEEEARARKIGLWADRDPVAPWDWRHGTAASVVKKSSRSGICHVPGSSGYSSVRYFTTYPTLEACLASGGRLPNGPH